MRLQRFALTTFALLAVFASFTANVEAAATGEGEVQEQDVPIRVTEVAPGLYFQYPHAEANNVFLITDEGVLVVDTRQHPRRAEERLATIRKYTNKPIRWVV